MILIVSLAVDINTNVNIILFSILQLVIVMFIHFWSGIKYTTDYNYGLCAIKENFSFCRS